jgi:hypothetical protein
VGRAEAVSSALIRSQREPRHQRAPSVALYFIYTASHGGQILDVFPVLIDELTQFLPPIRHGIFPLMDANQRDDEYAPEETAQRLERGLKRVLNMPHKPQVESSPKKQRPASKGRVRKGKAGR